MDSLPGYLATYEWGKMLFQTDKEIIIIHKDYDPSLPAVQMEI